MGNGEILRTVNEGDITLIHSCSGGLCQFCRSSVGFPLIVAADNVALCAGSNCCQHCQQC
uniref:hypothetical protein n=1 Tax=Segatella hominis TaxID=2518605 RepID=UPI00266FBA5B|nr:hypothetical protein [uncultured Prevotella sp.]